MFARGFLQKYDKRMKSSIEKNAIRRLTHSCEFIEKFSGIASAPKEPFFTNEIDTTSDQIVTKLIFGSAYRWLVSCTFDI